jgi:mannose-6-phosphate isomerase-like protein (cupin superfamily)
MSATARASSGRIRATISLDGLATRSNPSFLGLLSGPSPRTIGAMTDHTPYRLRRIEELESIRHGAVKLAGDDLGVESFGMQVLDLPPDFADYPEHDHAADRQEEVYVVLDGSAEFEVAGSRVPAEAGALLRVGPESRRKLVAGPRGVRILAVGCAPGGYVRPDAFRVRGQA